MGSGRDFIFRNSAGETVGLQYTIMVARMRLPPSLSNRFCDDYRWFSWGIASLRRASVGVCVSTAVCKMQASKRYIESLPSVLKDKRSCFSQGERFAVWLSLDHMRK